MQDVCEHQLYRLNALVGREQLTAIRSVPEK